MNKIRIAKLLREIRLIFKVEASVDKIDKEYLVFVELSR